MGTLLKQQRPVDPLLGEVPEERLGCEQGLLESVSSELSLEIFMTIISNPTV